MRKLVTLLFAASLLAPLSALAETTFPNTPAADAHSVPPRIIDLSYSLTRGKERVATVTTRTLDGAPLYVNTKQLSSFPESTTSAATSTQAFGTPTPAKPVSKQSFLTLTPRILSDNRISVNVDYSDADSNALRNDPDGKLLLTRQKSVVTSPNTLINAINGIPEKLVFVIKADGKLSEDYVLSVTATVRN